MTAQLAIKYRPRIFEDVAGQSMAKERLQKRVLNRSAGSVLLVGPTGAGKTTLATIFAKARLCLSPSASGSPCLTCQTCTDFESGRLWGYETRNCADQGGIFASSYEINRMRKGERTNGWFVCLLDEAHALTDRGGTALFDILEEELPDVCFILCTNRPSALPQALRDRLTTVQVEPVTWADLVLRGSTVAEAEQLPFSPDVLALLARQAQGSLRGMLASMDALAETQAWTLEKAIVQLAPSGLVQAYHVMSGLIRADMASAIQTLEDWQDSWSAKRTMVQDQLGLLLRAELLGPAGAFGIVDVVGQSERLSLLSLVASKAEAKQLLSSAMLERLVDVWHDQGSEETHARTLGRVSQSARLLALPLAQMQEDGRRTAKAPLRRFHDLQLPSPAPELWLSRSQAQAIWDAGSFMAQRFGIWLNTGVSVVEPCEADRVSTVGSLLQQARMLLGRRSPTATEQFHWMYVVRCDGKALLTNIALHVPEILHSDLAAWLNSRTQSGNVDESVTWKMGTKSPASQAKLLRGLLATLQPSLRDVDAKGDVTPLRHLIGLPKLAPMCAGDIGSRRRYCLSPGLNGTAQLRAFRSGMVVHRPFLERAYSFLDTGWEAAAYERMVVDEAGRMLEFGQSDPQPRYQPPWA